MHDNYQQISFIDGDNVLSGCLDFAQILPSLGVPFFLPHCTV
jgi:hypothetical protein